MTDQKVFEFQTEGLSYTVTVSLGEDGKYYAAITVIEGSADINAIYWGDDAIDGASAKLPGPLNMNGDGSTYEGEPVQWDDALKLSDPGLGRLGTEKETYLQAGDTLQIELPIESLDEIEFFGIRATSTSTPEGSIKAVSGDPETPDDPEDPDEPEDPPFDKVFFDYGTDPDGTSLGGFFILSEEPEENPFNIPALPEGTEPTFANYVSYFEEIGGDIRSITSVAFYETDENGDPVETFRFDAPEGGFADADAVIAAYDDAIATMAEEDAGEELMAFLSTGLLPEDEPYIEDEPELDEATLD